MSTPTSEPVTTNQVNITLAYEDASARTYNFKGVLLEELENVGTRARAVNANMPANFKNTFLSNSGAKAMQISKVQLISQEEEVIYNAG